jgi:hypothetical protein
MIIMNGENSWTLQVHASRGFRLLLRRSLWIDACTVAAVMLIELLGVYLAGGIKFATSPLRDPVREWLGQWYLIHLCACNRPNSIFVGHLFTRGCLIPLSRRGQSM